MNKAQRKRLAAIVVEVAGAQGLLQELRDELQESLDNTPENFQQSEPYQTKEQDVETLDTVLSVLDELATL